MTIDSGAPVRSKKTISINAPVGHVWATLTDIDSWTRWNPAIASSRLDSPIATGVSFRWKSGGMAIRSKVETLDSSQTIGWTGKALGTQARHLWQLRTENGVTVVSSEESMSGWLITLLKSTMQKMLDRSLEQWLAALKRQCEQSK